MPEDRRPYVAGNWKMWGTRAETRTFVRDLSARLDRDRSTEVGLCVPFTALEVAVAEAVGSGIKICAQNMHAQAEGAFTGEISAPMLVELGVDGVLIGHSERRQYFGETDAAVAEKVPMALEHGLEPIVCVGETEAEREGNETERRLRQQVGEALAKVPEARLGDVVIAYEPVWAIGTGKVATAAEAQEAIGFIRALVADRSSEAAGIRIQYGGSVKPGNAAEILAQPDVDGALVGGASLDPGDLATIAASA
jgi:triosephosphate isomerase